MRSPQPEQLRLAPGLTRPFLLHHRVCPKAFQADGSLLVGITEDALLEALGELSFAYGARVETERMPAEQWEQLVERVAAETDAAIEVASASEIDDDVLADVRNLANQPPVIRYVSLILREAHDAGASDIHLEAEREGLRARLRLDGVLSAAPQPPPGLQQAIVSRVKLLAELDIAERRRPQDGRIRFRLENRELDVRISTVPTLFGESVVLRLLDKGDRPVELRELGMPEHVFGGVDTLTRRAHGMLLVTGPTGSGKTTTLYAALKRRQTATEKVVTVEDPVEYQVDGLTQVPVHRQAGVSFASALRAILRHDPDVIMIGEMRDAETAEIGVQAALTGHLVFSTLHTNDAAGAIARLMDLGIPDYLVSACVSGVLAQRLVRRNCIHCAEPYVPDPKNLERLHELCPMPGEPRFQRGRGCSACRGTGFLGRIGVFELLLATDSVRACMMRGVPHYQLRRAAMDAGMRPLAADARVKIQDGLTNVEEVLRVLQEA